MLRDILFSFPRPSLRRPSGLGLIGFGLCALGLVGALGASAFLQWLERNESWPQVAVPGVKEVPLKAGSYVLYQEYPGARESSGNPLPALEPPSGTDLTVTDPEGNDVALSPLLITGNLPTGRGGRTLGAFTAQRTGLYRIASESLTGQLVVGRDGNLLFPATISVPMVILVVFVTPGATLLSVARWRRIFRLWERRNDARNGGSRWPPPGDKSQAPWSAPPPSWWVGGSGLTSQGRLRSPDRDRAVARR